MNRIYIIVGENSGDFIGSQLIDNLRKLKPSQFIFRGIGGKLMAAKNINLFSDYTLINLMGFFEIIPKIFRLREFINDTINDIEQFNPELLITIDSPGFNFRIAKQMRILKPRLKMMHIVAPSVWAYNPGRARKFADVYDHLLTILAFEAPYFEKEGLCTTYIGHPILEQSFITNRISTREISSSQEVKICLTPGSRIGEIKRHMKIFNETLNILHLSFPGLKAIFVLANQKHQVEIEKFLNSARYDYSFSTDKFYTFAEADLAIAKSGTNTIEISASGTPLVVCYKINSLSFWLLRFFLKIKYASIINLIADYEIIPEFIQVNCRSDKIAAAAKEILEKPDLRKKQIAECQKILSAMKVEVPPSKMAAQTIIKEFFK